MFWHPFWLFFIRSSITARPSRPSHFQPVLLSLQTTRPGEMSCRAVVHSAVWRQSTFQSVSGTGCTECRGRRVLGWAGLLLLLSVAALLWVGSRNRSSITHLIPGEVSLHLMKARSKLNGPWQLMDFPDPSWIRVKYTFFSKSSEFKNCSSKCSIEVYVEPWKYGAYP